MESGGASAEAMIGDEPGFFESAAAAAVGLDSEEIRIVAGREDAAAFASRLTREGVETVRATVTPESFRRALARSEGGVFRLVGERGPRLRDAIARGLVVPGNTDAMWLARLLHVNDHAYGNVVRIAGRLGPGKAAGALDSELLREADLDGPEGELLVELIDISSFPPLESDLKKLRSLEHPLAWLRARRERLRGLEPALRTRDGGESYRRACVHTEERIVDLVADGRWDDAVKVAALDENAYLTPGRFNPEGHLERLRERFEFWQTDVPRPVIVSKMSAETGRLLSRRVSFLRAMKEMLSPEAYEDALTHPVAAARFAGFGHAIAPVYRLNPETFERFASREALPVESAPGAEERAEEVRDVIAAMGFEPVLRAVALRVVAVEPNGGWNASGGYDSLRGEITVGANGPYRRRIPTLLLHEAGHGVHKLLDWDDDGELLMARYAVAAALEPQTHSDYAESFKWRPDGSLHTFVAESFAEDFRLYFLMPERLPDRKRNVIDRIVRERFPDIDPDDVRARTRRVLGNFYGARVDEAAVPTDCEQTRKFARHAARIQAENARDAYPANKGR